MDFPLVSGHKTSACRGSIPHAKAHSFVIRRDAFGNAKRSDDFLNSITFASPIKITSYKPDEVPIFPITWRSYDEKQRNVSVLLELSVLFRLNAKLSEPMPTLMHEIVKEAQNLAASVFEDHVTLTIEPMHLLKNEKGEIEADAKYYPDIDRILLSTSMIEMSHEKRINVIVHELRHRAVLKHHCVPYRDFSLFRPFISLEREDKIRQFVRKVCLPNKYEGEVDASMIEEISSIIFKQGMKQEVLKRLLWSSEGSTVFGCQAL